MRTIGEVVLAVLVTVTFRHFMHSRYYTMALLRVAIKSQVPSIYHQTAHLVQNASLRPYMYQMTGLVSKRQVYCCQLSVSGPRPARKRDSFVAAKLLRSSLAQSTRHPRPSQRAQWPVSPSTWDLGGGFFTTPVGCRSPSPLESREVGRRVYESLLVLILRVFATFFSFLP